MDEAVAVFRQQCDTELLKDLAKVDVGAIAPGRFRLVVQEEWAVFKTEMGNR
jgi:hypothetical protein